MDTTDTANGCEFGSHIRCLLKWCFCCFMYWSRRVL